MTPYSENTKDKGIDSRSISYKGSLNPNSYKNNSNTIESNSILSKNSSDNDKFFGKSNTNTFNNKEKLYEAALLQIEQTYPSSSFAGLAMFLRAQEWQNKGMEYSRSNKTNQFDLIKAIENFGLFTRSFFSSCSIFAGSIQRGKYRGTFLQ
jgi:hypothetical protein